MSPATTWIAQDTLKPTAWTRCDGEEGEGTSSTDRTRDVPCGYS